MLRYCSFPLLLLFPFFSAFTQQLDSLLEIQRKADAREKIYVHFDKAYYNPGETIWFKAYLFTGVEPSQVSTNFYAELLDEEGNVLSQRTAPIAFSSATGSFDIDSNFSRPIVYFRAYTMAMLNSDTSFLYTKAIRILSPKAAPAKRETAKPGSKIRFLPEGGDWVAGLPGTVAFMATNTRELPVAISGKITDNTGAEVAALKTLHQGMGKVTMTPEADKTYTATWTDENGKQYTTKLPAIKPQGIILRITDEGANKRFTIYRTEQAPDAMKRLHLIAHMNQQLAFKADIRMADKLVATGLLPVGVLPSGILQITVFDSSFRPLAERITFVNNHNHEFDGDAYLVRRSLTRRGLNEVEIMVSDTVPANLSLSVTDADLHESNRMEDNIVSRMLLTGELRGKIVNPYYYFFSTDDSAAVRLDLVMLTHGWRRYNWDHVLAGKTATPKWKENDYLALSGQVVGLPPGSFGADLQLTGILQTVDSAKNFMVLPVDRKGRVFTEGLVFYDKAKLFFSFNKESLSFDKSMLVLDNGLRKTFKQVRFDSTLKMGVPNISAFTIANNNKVAQMALEQSRQHARSITLQNVTVKASAKPTKEKMEEKYVSGLFSGDARSFDLVNDPLASGYMDIFQFLQGRVAGLQITTGAGGPSLSWRGGTPALYLNEMKTDAGMLSATPVSDIAYVKVFRPGESIVSGGGGGVIAIYTRKGGDVQPDPNAKGLNYVQLTGYSAIKEFYSPDYATVSETGDADDVRTTLYWNPSIYLDKSRRRIRLRFYNNDITKQFRLVLEGIDATGRLIHVEKEVVDLSK